MRLATDTDPRQLNADDHEFPQRAWTRTPLLFARHPAPLAMPVFDFERIKGLIPSMKPADIIYRDASAGVGVQMKRLPVAQWAAQPLHDKLASETTSLMLQNVHIYDPGCRDTLERLMDWVAESLGVPRRDLRHPTASIFLSSPRAISSYHTDREQNFLAQLHGEKTVHVFPRRITVPQELLIALFRKRKGIHFEYDSSMEDSARLFHLRPGNTLYLPRNRPHWVRNGDQVSMSISINFFRPPDHALERFYELNDKFRARLGKLAKAAAANGKP